MALSLAGSSSNERPIVTSTYFLIALFASLWTGLGVGGEPVASAETALRAIGHDPDGYDCRISDVGPLDVFFPDDPPGPPEMTIVCSPKQETDSYSLRITNVRRPIVEWIWDPPARTAWQERVFRRAHEEWERDGVAPGAFEQVDFRVKEYERCLRIEGWKRSRRSAIPTEDGALLIHLGASSFVNLNKHDLSILETCP